MNIDEFLALHERLTGAWEPAFEPTPKPTDAELEAGTDVLRSGRPKDLIISAAGHAWLEDARRYEAERKALEHAGVDVDYAIIKRFRRAPRNLDALMGAVRERAAATVEQEAV